MRTLAFLCLVTVAFAADPSTGKKLVFSDDFNGDKLDESKWRVTGGSDLFTFVKVGKENALRIGLKMGADMIQSNSISTRGKFSQQYGYFEASMRMNASDGHSGIFRLATDDEKTAPSITVSFHATGKDRVNPWARATLESGQQDFRPEKPIPAQKSGDVAKKFHTYGILWTDKAFTWYMDGKVMHKLERKEFTRPMNLTLTHRILEEDRPKLNLKSLPDD
ncbi:MAG: glycoside hydrolase family 16 protein, partial [Verrucomicrobia bacterium]|nr:glycoside hydrolase family 16 protein [Verrucomicrobiota bacterium]